ncbi:MAG: hypothetical protein AB8D52_10095 [Gammaproteobacteria bacterium]
MSDNATLIQSIKLIFKLAVTTSKDTHEQKPYDENMNRKPKTSNLAFFLIYLCSYGCSDPDLPDPVKVKNNQYVIVKATNFQSNKLTYGAIKLIRQSLDKQPNLVYEWLYFDNEETTVLADSKNLILGESSNEEKHGISFGQFDIDWSFSKTGEGWLNPLPTDDKQHNYSYSTRFCVSEIYDKIWGINLSEICCTYH